MLFTKLAATPTHLRARWTVLRIRAEERVCVVLSVKLKPEIFEEKEQMHTRLVKASFNLGVYLGLASQSGF